MTDLGPNRRRRLALCKRDQGEAGFPFGQGDQRLPFALAKDRIHFPISQALSAVDDSWTLVNTAGMEYFSSPIIASDPFATLPELSQVLVQGSTPAFVFENSLARASACLRPVRETTPV
jgi:hypothetical protein